MKDSNTGQSENPAGRRRGSVSLSATLKSRLTKADAREVADKLIADAKRGNRHAIRVILERCEVPIDSRTSPATAIFRMPDNGRGGTYPPPDDEMPR